MDKDVIFERFSKCGVYLYEFWKSFSCFSLSGMAIKFLVEDEADVVMSMFSQQQPILELVNGPPGPMFHLVTM